MELWWAFSRLVTVRFCYYYYFFLEPVPQSLWGGTAVFDTLLGENSRLALLIWSPSSRPVYFDSPCEP